MDGRFDALASYLLEGLRMQGGRVVDTLSLLEANGLQEDMGVNRSEPGDVLCAIIPHHTHVQ